MEGLTPPQAQDIEEAVLGALLLEKSAMLLADSIISSETFYNPKHGLVYKAIKKLYDNLEPVDITTVTNQLRKDGNLESVGGAYFVASLTNRIGSAANCEFHCRIIQEKFMRREAIRISGEIIKTAFDESVDTFDVLDFAERGFKAIGVQESTSLIHIGDGLSQVYNDYNQVKEKGIESIGIKLQLPGADEIVGMVMPGDLVIIGGRPSMGKTMTMLHIARMHAKENTRGLVFSVEMTAKKIIARIAAADALIASDDLKNGKLSTDEEQRLNVTIGRLENAPLHIEDSINEISKLRSAARLHKSKHPDLKYIMVDYLQIMTGSNPMEAKGNRDAFIGYLTRTCKQIAKELGVVFYLLAQVGRASEKNGTTLESKKPNMADLRESGNIEQDADIIIFPFRPAYYGFEYDEENNDLRKDIWWLIRKNRDGAVGEGVAKCDLVMQRIFSESESFTMPTGGSDFDNFEPSPFRNFYETD